MHSIRAIAASTALLNEADIAEVQELLAPQRLERITSQPFGDKAERSFLRVPQARIPPAAGVPIRTAAVGIFVGRLLQKDAQLSAMVGIFVVNSEVRKRLKIGNIEQF